MNGLDFEQLKELDIKKVQDLEKEFPKIQGFLYNEEKNTLVKLDSEVRSGMSECAISITPYAEKLIKELEGSVK